VNESLITGANLPIGVAVDGQHIYWTNFSINTIGEANLDGSAVNESLIATANKPYGVAVAVPVAQVSPRRRRRLRVRRSERSARLRR
jgi:hypothetical protein